MEEFLNSKTMLTPGVAGGITTLITASMSSQFNFPGKWTGLVVSFLFGSFIAYADADKH
jgi:hypothetical protein